jgi:hypothetical protein
MKYASVSLFVAAAAVVALSLVGFAQGDRVDITGKWLFSVTTTAGSGTPTITLIQDGEKLTGHYSGQLGEADLKGSVKGQDFSFTFTVVVEGMKLECTYTGRVGSKDSLAGKVDISGLATGTFTAARQ